MFHQNITGMIYKPIITDFDDQDAYKYFMSFAIIKHYPDDEVRYKLILRDDIVFPDGFDNELREQVEQFKYIRFTKEIEDHLFEKLPYFDSSYRYYLRSYRYDPSNVHINQKDGKLDIYIEGLWHKTIFWEVPLMALISELYFKMTEQKFDLNPRKNKYLGLKELGVKVAEFGTRRRASKEVQGMVINDFIHFAPDVIVGTSNVMFARKFNLSAIGTQAHEWFMFHGAKYGFNMANRIGLGRWVDVYHGELGIALSDTYTSDIFFKDFDMFYSKLFDGVRQDSGNPLDFIDKTIKHYKDNGISLPNGFIPKTIVFSDNLNSLDKIKIIKDKVDGKILYSFGIGTWLSNDVGVKPLNMVIKLVNAKPKGMGWLNCIKLSDSNGKHTGDVDTVKLCKKVLNIE